MGGKWKAYLLDFFLLYVKTCMEGHVNLKFWYVNLLFSIVACFYILLVNFVFAKFVSFKEFGGFF